MDAETLPPAGNYLMADALAAGSLSLRVLTLDDVEALHVIFSDPSTHTLDGGPSSSIDETRGWLERRVLRREDYGVTWYGVYSAAEDLIGNCGLFMGRTGAEPELGFEILAQSQGQRYGQSAASAVVAEGHRAGFERIWATVRPTNKASLRALSKVGFKPDTPDVGVYDDLVYLVHSG